MDSQMFIYRVLAMNGARNAIREAIPAFVSRVNCRAMRARLAGPAPSGDAGSSRLNGASGANEDAYKSFLERFDGSAKYSGEAAADEEPAPEGSPGQDSAGSYVDVPADPFYQSFRDSPSGFQGTMPAPLARQIYMLHGDTARFGPIQIEVCSANHDREKEDVVRGVIAFTTDCTMGWEKYSVRRVLQVHKRYILAPAAPNSRSTLLAIERGTLSEALLNPGDDD